MRDMNAMMAKHRVKRDEVAILAEDTRMRIEDAPYLTKAEKVQICRSVGMSNNMKPGKDAEVSTGTVAVHKKTRLLRLRMHF